ncbi:MAG: hypothetical protein OEV07_13605 [Gammaproteobacteria bacterium]|nr:hypothetical protein [Gammaproteobacteria bacterium]
MATAMSDEATHLYYSSKPRLIHMALNIAFAPVLLYLLGVWAWPPVLPHYIVFAITSLMALHYARKRWTAPRLVLDEKGLYCGSFYPAENIYRAEGSIRSVTLTVLTDGKVKEKIISLGWASRDDYKAIVQLLSERFQREVPK